MNKTIAQLQTVAQMSRLLLLTQRILQASSVLLAIALISGISDYLLRLPGIVRLVSDLLVILLGVAWLGTRLVYVSRFSPSLTDFGFACGSALPASATQVCQCCGFVLVHAPTATHSDSMRRLEDLSLESCSVSEHG